MFGFMSFWVLAWNGLVINNTSPSAIYRSANAASPVLCIFISTPPFVADSILIWRCNILWGSRYILAVLLTLLTASIVLIVVAGVPTETHLQNILSSLSSLFSVITTLSTTFLIALKIVLTTRRSRMRQFYTKIIEILVQSAGLVTFIVLTSPQRYPRRPASKQSDQACSSRVNEISPTVTYHNHGSHSPESIPPTPTDGLPTSASRTQAARRTALREHLPLRLPSSLSDDDPATANTKLKDEVDAQLKKQEHMQFLVWHLANGFPMRYLCQDATQPLLTSLDSADFSVLQVGMDRFQCGIIDKALTWLLCAGGYSTGAPFTRLPSIFDSLFSCSRLHLVSDVFFILYVLLPAHIR
ncbi:hypothetical protein D9619_006907 [Psilocybe cf. subviscida]|uniref:Uncharacterized protein n=1 Tax=Psilocybe cf. subviscida TaxID=2480587 RepID=A0A8H5B3T4_9AGAR|nr:hypothetical protein D9619_006907 [Psilocybe cf. subviscida]